MDLGAQVSVLHFSVLCSLHRTNQIVPTKRKLHAYGGREIITLGTVLLSVTYRDVVLPSFEFVVVKNGNSLMGLDLFDALGFEIRDSAKELCAIEQSNAADWVDYAKLSEEAKQLLHSNAALRQHSELLHVNSSKKIRRFVHSPVIDVTATPVVQRHRRLPLALTEKVKQEVDRLVNDHILEPIESSPWVCNMVIVPKSSGAIPICADLSDANRAVVPDRYPLPTIEELSDFFAGSEVFSKIDLKWGYLQVELVESARYCNDYWNDNALGTIPVAASSVWSIERSFVLSENNRECFIRHRRISVFSRRHRYIRFYKARTRRTTSTGSHASWRL